MDAKIVWNTWRKILRNESLQQRLLNENWEFQNSDAYLPEEKDVIAAYAENMNRAKWFIENYQFRLINSFVNALETGAPLTLRALLNCEVMIPELSRQFLRVQQWHDYGPRVYSYCRDVLQWLIQTSENWRLPSPIVDLMKLEYESVSLYLSFQQGSSSLGPQTSGYSHTGMARLYCSQFMLSQWLRDKKHLGLTQPSQGKENMLIVLPDMSSRHKFILLPERCAELFIKPESAGVIPDTNDCHHLERLTKLNALVFWGPENEV